MKQLSNVKIQQDVFVTELKYQAFKFFLDARIKIY